MNTLVVSYGTNPREMVLQALAALDVAKALRPAMRIGIKPNLVVEKPASSGATTSPEVVAGIIEYLHAAGCKDITILESSAVGHRTERAFAVCGYTRLASRYGVKLVDLKHDATQKVTAHGQEMCVCRTALSLDYFINVPVLKAHCQTRLTCALKNLKGCLPDSEKRRFHALGLHRPIAALNQVVKSDLIVVDGLCGDLTFEEGGNPVAMDQVLVGRDPVLVDAYAATALGYEPLTIPYIRLAAELGLGSAQCEQADILVLNREVRPLAAPTVSPLARELSRWVEERSACSICYGNLLRALACLREDGVLARLTHKIKIGQGFRGQGGPGPGAGSCTAGLSLNLPGCPPATKDIVKFLNARLLVSQPGSV